MPRKSLGSATTTKGQINIYQDEDEFEFPTGDKYSGGYMAKKKEKTALMHGLGTYTSAQGDSYTGVWANDILTNEEQVSIKFPDKSTYQGNFFNWKYSGWGKIVYPDGTEIMGRFNNNMPEGELELKDPNGKSWFGNAGKGSAWFRPTNHYYDYLDNRKMKKKITK